MLIQCVSESYKIIRVERHWRGGGGGGEKNLFIE
jgi:hypothetical protein